LGFRSAKAATQASIVPSIGIELPPVNEAVSAFRVAIAPDAIAYLRRRLVATRWPEQETVNDWSQAYR